MHSRKEEFSEDKVYDLWIKTSLSLSRITRVEVKI